MPDAFLDVFETCFVILVTIFDILVPKVNLACR